MSHSTYLMLCNQLISNKKFYSLFFMKNDKKKIKKPEQVWEFSYIWNKTDLGLRNVTQNGFCSCINQWLKITRHGQYFLNQKQEGGMKAMT